MMETTALTLARAKGPVTYGRALLAYMQAQELGPTEAASRLRLKYNSFHTYISIARGDLAPDLQEATEHGQLNVKEARAIATLSPYDLQRQVAAVFTQNRLSSMFVEPLCTLVRQNPSADLEDLISAVMSAKGYPKTYKPNRTPPEITHEPQPIDPVKLQKDALALAGKLDAVRLQQIPEYQRRPLQSTLAILSRQVIATATVLANGSLPILEELRSRNPAKAAPNGVA